MADLIDRSALPYENQVLSIDEDWCLKVSDIEAASAVDAVPVVRCKDCIWFMHDSLCPLELSGFTKGGKSIPLEDDYCSYGERKTE